MDHFFSLNSGALFIADTGAFYIADDNQGIIIERIAIYLGYKAIHKIRFLVSG